MYIVIMRRVIKGIHCTYYILVIYSSGSLDVLFLYLFIICLKFSVWPAKALARWCRLGLFENT